MTSSQITCSSDIIRSVDILFIYYLPAFSLSSIAFIFHISPLPLWSHQFTVQRVHYTALIIDITLWLFQYFLVDLIYFSIFQQLHLNCKCSYNGHRDRSKYCSLFFDFLSFPPVFIFCVCIVVILFIFTSFHQFCWNWSWLWFVRQLWMQHRAFSLPFKLNGRFFLVSFCETSCKHNCKYRNCMQSTLHNIHSLEYIS